MIGRRAFLGSAAATTALSAPAKSQPARVLRYVPQADLGSIDPIWTTSVVTRDHGFMVYDTLFGTDANFQPTPQLAEGYSLEQEGRVCIVRLRAGLRFHDGEPIRARDCVASLERWMVRAPIGQKLKSVLDEMSAPDDLTIRFRLKRPLPYLIPMLGLPATPVPFIMPERVARTDPFQQVTDTTGSGPFRYLTREHIPGSFSAYAPFADYRPTPAGGTGLTAGPKVTHFDRIEWHTLPDAATAAAALQRGEMDWFCQPPPEVLELLRRSRGISVGPLDLLPYTLLLRFNSLNPPFDNPAIRRALLPAIDQADFVAACVGNNVEAGITGTGVFPAGSPSASDAGLEPLRGPRSIDLAKQRLKEAGYSGQLVRILGPTDILNPSALTQVGIDLFRRLGMNLDIQLTDWASVVQRRPNKEPPERGGWSVSFYSNPGIDLLNPATNALLRGNGAGAWFGWPTIPRLEELRESWFDAAEPAAQAAITREMQSVAMRELPFVPLGGLRNFTATRADLRDRVVGSPIFWNLKRA
ncbi:ABC transporter substrate-binding protein [Pararoseomonas sp. SCSIO 73927]|uniref:ABC transporter substrate-binding protein n=1 Tax=Pararoseomonas sp. SCSIO 73927 TaxID=3114537 RepID=UPI0030CD2C0A